MPIQDKLKKKDKSRDKDNKKTTITNSQSNSSQENTNSSDPDPPTNAKELTTCQSQSDRSTNYPLTLAFIDDLRHVMFYRVSDELVPPPVPSADQLLKMSFIPEWNEQQGRWKVAGGKGNK